MSSNGNGGALSSIAHQKKVQQLKYNETVKARKIRQEGDLSIAASRGLLKMVTNTNMLGYNSKMKLLNDKLSTQIMNKYKTKDNSPTSSFRSYENVNLIKFVVDKIKLLEFHLKI
jgi:hypothetical protein